MARRRREISEDEDGSLRTADVAEVGFCKKHMKGLIIAAVTVAVLAIGGTLVGVFWGKTDRANGRLKGEVDSVRGENDKITGEKNDLQNQLTQSQQIIDELKTNGVFTPLTEGGDVATDVNKTEHLSTFKNYMQEKQGTNAKFDSYYCENGKLTMLFKTYNEEYGSNVTVAVTLKSPGGEYTVLDVEAALRDQSKSTNLQDRPVVNEFVSDPSVFVSGSSKKALNALTGAIASQKNSVNITDKVTKGETAEWESGPEYAINVSTPDAKGNRKLSVLVLEKTDGKLHIREIESGKSVNDSELSSAIVGSIAKYATAQGLDANKIVEAATAVEAE